MINGLCAGSLLISYLSVHINPDVFAIPAFFGLAYPYLLLVNIVFAVIWAVKLKYEALISVAAILLGLTHFTNYIKLSKTGIDRENTFKVISYNLHMFEKASGRNSVSTKEEILGILKDMNIDILCFQEYPSSRRTIVSEQEIANGLGGGYNSHVKSSGSGSRNYSLGIATYTRFPIVGKGELVFRGSSSLSIYTDVLIDRDTFRVFNNHLQSFGLREMNNSLVEELIDDEKQTIRELRSLFSRLRRGFQRRSVQAKELKDNINSSPYPVIVTGDFNDTPVSYSYRKIRKGLKDSFVQAGSGAGFTYSGNYPPNRIDYILYDDELQCTSFEILRLKISDHYPIISWFRKAEKKEAL